MGIFLVCFPSLAADVKYFAALATQTWWKIKLSPVCSQTGQGMAKRPVVTLPELQRSCVQVEGCSSKLNIWARLEEEDSRSTIKDAKNPALSQNGAGSSTDPRPGQPCTESVGKNVTEPVTVPVPFISPHLHLLSLFLSPPPAQW